MSLLMDALRKAEADKKQAAAQASGSADPSAPEPVPPAVAVATSASQATIEASAENDWSHNLLVDEDNDDALGVFEAVTKSGIIALEPPAPALALEPMALEDRSEESFSGLDDTTIGGMPDGDATPTIASPRWLGEPLSSGFNPGDTNGRGRRQPPASTPRKEALGPVFGQTMVTAQTVFEAGIPASAQRLLTIAIAATATLALLLTGAGFYYFRQIPPPPWVPSPLVAGGVEKPLPRRIPDVPAIPTETKPPIAAAIVPDVIPPPAAAAPADEALGAPSVAPDSSVAAAVPSRLASTGTAAVETPAVMPAPVQPAPIAKPRSPLAAKPKPVIPPTGAEVEIVSGEVRIARTPPTLAINPIIHQAYSEFAAGKLAVAEQLYQQVLKTNPDQKDALLGLAAIAVRGGKVAQAHQYYRKVLKLDANDTTASAGLFMLEGGAGDKITESRLKLLADQERDDAYIQFALGTLYARQQRWPDAQQAYFAAYSRDPANADYAYNLAVSLDRIGQRDAAIKFYRKALELALNKTSGFTPAQVLARLQALGAAPN